MVETPLTEEYPLHTQMEGWRRSMPKNKNHPVGANCVRSSELKKTRRCSSPLVDDINHLLTAYEKEKVMTC